MALPQLTEQERKAALEKAARARKERAEIREKLKSGDMTVEQVLARGDDPVVARMRVSMLIESLPGYGKAKAAKLMEDLEISGSRRIKGLGTRQREALLERLGSK